MIIKCEKNITSPQFETILKHISSLGLQPDILRQPGNEMPPVIGLKGECSHIQPDEFIKLEGVNSVQRITVPYKMASRSYNADDTVINVHGVEIGGNRPLIIMAGPCAVESRDQIMEIASLVASNGARILRGGAWKPRTFARSFEGLKEQGLKFLKEAGDAVNMPVITEVISPDLIEIVSRYADIIQVGARNMQNFDLLDRLGRQPKPVLLKRGVSATLDEFLGAADRILEGGNRNVMLCLRGVRTFDYSQRYPADLYAIPDLRRKTHLPIVFDPSHAAGNRALVPELARMAIAGGVNALIIEAHPSPCNALCDGAQMIPPEELGKLASFAAKLRELENLQR
ncbi:MAG: 3-deoxy-7-phosphoheptulonate synthase [Candidatus Wallbacteria bacterium]|nr:3-deoxy-7-phosphoheptulonate synthase [Candidatus Wallbacteria bacterium]